MAAAIGNRERLFTAAAALTDLATRAAFLNAACAGDIALRAEVEELLRHDAEVGSFLASGVAPERTIDDPSVTERPGVQIGPYKLMEQLGEGGFGLVFVAEQTEPVRRKVALKVVKPGMDTREVLARFAAERQALALMDHPNIARVFDGGATEAGRPYFVMELVRGIPITDYCDQNQLAPRPRLELFVSVCHAVQHAHQKGIIHRDIKPSNVLVTSHDGRPVVKVIDFGVAKAIGQKLTERTVYTQLAQMVGTPLYMSPEQAEMSGLDIDTRSDIYSLGVLLYELLTGTTPFDRERLAKAGLDEIRRVIREEEPEKPSTRLSHSGDRLPSVAAQRKTEPARLSRLVRGDLDWITMKCLEKERGRRYETANGLAMDVQRYLADEPVVAGPPSAGYRVRKFVRRNKAAVVTAAVMVGLLIGGVVGTTWGLIRAEAARKAERERAEGEAAERRRADDERRVAEAVRSFLEDDLLRLADPVAQADDLPRDRGATGDFANPPIKVLLDRAARALTAERIESKFPGQPVVQAGVLKSIGDAYRNTGDHAKAIAHLRRAQDLQAAALGPDHRETLLTQSSLAMAFRDAGNPAEAVRLMEPARDGLERSLGPDHKDTLTATDRLGQAYKAAGQHAQAIRLAESVHRACEVRNGPEHGETLIALGNLAVAYQFAGRLSDAIRLYERIREVRVKTQGLEHPSTLTTLNNLATAYQTAGRLPDAIRVFEQVRATEGRGFGADHPFYLTMLYNLGDAYRAANRPADAIPLLEQVRDARARKLGPDHPGTLSALNNLAMAYTIGGRSADAIRVWEDLVPRARRTAHPATATFTKSWIVVLERDRQFDAAAALGREWLNFERQALPPGDARLAGPLEVLALSLIKSGRPAEAEPVVRECLSIRQSNEPGAWPSFHVLSLLAQALIDQQKFAEAEPLARQSYEGLQALEATLPAEGKQRLQASLNRVIALYTKWGKPDEAAKWRAKAAKP